MSLTLLLEYTIWYTVQHLSQKPKGNILTIFKLLFLGGSINSLYSWSWPFYFFSISNSANIMEYSTIGLNSLAMHGLYSECYHLLLRLLHIVTLDIWYACENDDPQKRKWDTKFSSTQQRENRQQRYMRRLFLLHWVIV